MSTVTSRCFYQVKKSYCLLPFSCSSARATSEIFAKSKCQIRTSYLLASPSSSIFRYKMSGDFHQKRFSHYKAAILKESGEKLQIVELKRSSKLKETQV